MRRGASARSLNSAYWTCGSRVEGDAARAARPARRSARSDESMHGMTTSVRRCGPRPRRAPARGSRARHRLADQPVDQADDQLADRKGQQQRGQRQPNRPTRTRQPRHAASARPPSAASAGPAPPDADRQRRAGWRQPLGEKTGGERPAQRLTRRRAPVARAASGASGASARRRRGTHQLGSDPRFRQAAVDADCSTRAQRLVLRVLALGGRPAKSAPAMPP